MWEKGCHHAGVDYRARARGSSRNRCREQNRRRAEAENEHDHNVVPAQVCAASRGIVCGSTRVLKVHVETVLVEACHPTLAGKRGFHGDDLNKKGEPEVRRYDHHVVQGEGSSTSWPRGSCCGTRQLMNWTRLKPAPTPMTRATGKGARDVLDMLAKAEAVTFMGAQVSPCTPARTDLTRNSPSRGSRRTCRIQRERAFARDGAVLLWHVRCGHLPDLRTTVIAKMWSCGSALTGEATRTPVASRRRQEQHRSVSTEKTLGA